MTPTEDKVPSNPICPHCGRGAKNKETCNLAGRGIMMGGIPFMIVMCDGCRKIITVCPMPLPPMMAPERPQSSLILPS